MVKVRSNMDTCVVFVDASAAVIEAVNKMLQNEVWSLIVKKDGLPEGVITDRDIIRRCVSKGLNSNTLPVEQIMSSPLITIGPEQPLREALNLMYEKNIRRVFVVEDGKIIGRVTQTGACRNLYDMIAGLSAISNVL